MSTTMISQFPTCNEMDPLDQSLDELDDPSSNFLQDFLTHQNNTDDISTTSSVHGTPMSGYTSEDSDFSNVNPEEPIDEKMSFVPAQIQGGETNFTELAEFPTSTHNFDGKVIKGKTSKYRGVTQTSKTSWGAKYSAKRITNTCKTPEEAARAYDLFLKENHPKKYAKFANFCITCNRFVNPLGLSQYQNECICENASNIQQNSPAYTDTETETDGDSPTYDMDEANCKLDSYKFQLHTAKEHVPLVEDATFTSTRMMDTDVTKENFMITADSVNNHPVQEEEYSVDEFLRQDVDVSSIVLNDELFVEEYMNEPNTNAASIEAMMKMEDKETEPIATVASSDQLRTNERSSSSFMEFSAQELNDLHECLANSSSMEIIGEVASLNHFDDMNSLSTIIESQPTTIDAEVAAAVSSNPILRDNSFDLDFPSMELFAQVASPSSSAFSSSILFQTPFLEKYWRNDRKNIQCFPFCPEHGDYYRVRIGNLQHRCKNVCRAPVKAILSIQTDFPLDTTKLFVMARCNSTFSRNFVFTSKQMLSLEELQKLQSISTNGTFENIKYFSTRNTIEIDLTFYPDVWKFEFDLPKKRRHPSLGISGSSDLVVREEGSEECAYFFEVDIFYTTDKMNFLRLGHHESVQFQIGNTRTLLRQKNKMSDDSNNSKQSSSSSSPSPSITFGNTSSTPMDIVTTPSLLASMDYYYVEEDSQMDINELPEKKKIKMKLGQLGRSSTKSMRLSGEMQDQMDEALIPKGFNKSKPLIDEDSVAAAVLELASVTNDEYALTPAHKRIGSRNQAYSATEIPMRAAFQENPEQESRRNHHVPTHSKVQPDVALESGEYHENLNNNTSENNQVGISGLIFYSLFCIPLSVFYVPVAVLLLVSFLLLPPLAGSIAKSIDVLGDFELRQANRHTTSNDVRMVLNRLEMDSFSYHRQSTTWNRFVYLIVGKLIVSTLVCAITLPLAILGLVLYPIRSASPIFLLGAMSVALFGRDYTRKTFGRRLQGGPSHSGSIRLV